MGAISYQITILTIVYLLVYSDADQRKHQSSVSLAFVRGIHRGPVITSYAEMFPFDDVIMNYMMWYDCSLAAMVNVTFPNNAVFMIATFDFYVIMHHSQLMHQAFPMQHRMLQRNTYWWSKVRIHQNCDIVVTVR